MMIEDFIKELEGNKKLNKRKGLQNNIDIDYVIERLKDIQLDYELADNYIEFYKRLSDDQAELITELKNRTLKAIEHIEYYGKEKQLEEDYLMSRTNLANYNCMLLDILEGKW